MNTERMSDEKFRAYGEQFHFHGAHGFRVKETTLYAEARRARASESALLARVAELEQTLTATEATT